jgi:mlo protein
MFYELLIWHSSYHEIKSQKRFIIFLMASLFNFYFQQSFFKQFYGSVTRSDYITLRLGFIMVGSWLYSHLNSTYPFLKKKTQICRKETLLHIFKGFLLQTHCRGNLKFNFHKYMMRALEADFKKVVGIRLVIFICH